MAIRQAIVPFDFRRSDQITIKYHGGIADQGALNFYEYSRASYALSRILATLGHYRQTTQVPDRITSKSNSRILIRAPERGSFPIDVFSPESGALAAALGGVAIQALAEVPLSVLFEYVLGSLFGGTRNSEDVSKIIDFLQKSQENDLEKDRIRLLLSQEETKRMEFILSNQSQQQDISASHIKELLEIVKNNSMILPSAVASLDGISRIFQSVSNEIETDSRHEKYRDGLEYVDKDIVKIRKKMRTQIQDLSVPFRKSATYATIHANDNEEASTRFDEIDIRSIDERELSTESFEEQGNVTAYDKLFGYGKCQIGAIGGDSRISFSVAPSARKRLLPKLSEAFKESEVKIGFRKFLNVDEVMTSIQIDYIEL